MKLPRKINSLFLILINALRYTEPKIKVLKALSRGKSVDCHVKSGQYSFPAIVTRRNIRRIIPEVLQLQEKDWFKVKDISRTSIRSFIDGKEFSSEIEPFLENNDSR